jgi:BCD family chlorophyll transporter-like MFS transporter
MSNEGLGWGGIARLGLVQAALGAIVVLATSTMNRVMVVELALPALLPGALVGIHYALQVLRPRFGYGSDVGGRRTPWIIGGMAVLGAGVALAAVAIAWAGTSPAAGIALSVLAYLLIGVGVGAGGTSLLVLLATHVAAHRRAAAATVVWLMMIMGFVVSTLVVGQLLDPYTPARLVAIASGVAAVAIVVTVLALHGVEDGRRVLATADEAGTDNSGGFRAALREVWGEHDARAFTVFIFVSMLAYSAQDLILEPFAGSVFGMTPGQSTQLAGIQHGGVMVGMLLVAFFGSIVGGPWLGSLRLWTIGGCLASAVALGALVVAGQVGPDWPLKPTVFALGLANGAFAVAAIGSMMGFAASGTPGREGTRMGLWGAAQAIAFGIGGMLGAGASDFARALLATDGTAYGVVFALEAVLFIVAARLAARLSRAAWRHAAKPAPRSYTPALAAPEASP